MFVVTGGAGFIGSNIIEGLNRKGETDILVVDNLENGRKFINLVDLNILDYEDKRDFINRIETKSTLGKIDCIIHMGACSATTEWDGRYMMDNNFVYTKSLYQYAQDHKIPFLYASSAAVYGGSPVFKEDPAHEGPLNVYGYSKLLFDNYLRRQTPKSQVAGFRFFNVYGPREQHKGSMASVAFHHNTQLTQRNGTVKLFGSYDGYEAGEQKRDFVYVKDAVKVLLWFIEHPEKSGIFNLGTGRAQSFNDIANAVIDHHGKGRIEYIDFPEHLKNAYQSFTQADISTLRNAGYEHPFYSVEQGVADYLSIINGKS